MAGCVIRQGNATVAPMTKKRRFNKRHTYRNPRYTPPRQTTDLFGFEHFGRLIPRSILGRPPLIVINYPIRPQLEVVAGVLTLFFGGENHHISHQQVVIGQGVIEERGVIESVFPTSLGLAHIVYLPRTCSVVLTAGHSNLNDLSNYLSNKEETLKHLDRRVGDGESFRNVSSTVAMREALDIAARAGFAVPSGFEVDEYCVELIRKRWNFGSNTSFVEAVEQGMNDARRTTSRSRPALTSFSPRNSAVTMTAPRKLDDELHH